MQLTFSQNFGSVAIGPAQGGLYNTISRTDGRRDGDFIGLYRHSLVGGVGEYHAIHPFVIRRFTVTVLGEVTVFTRTTSGTYVFKEGKGGTLVEGGGGSYTYTAPDGTIATFSSSVRSYADEDTIASAAGLTSIRRPNGEVLTYHYAGSTDTTRVLQSVTNNHGYQIHFQYSAGTATKVEAINNAVDPCDPLAAVCSGFTRAWPTLTLVGGAWRNALDQARATSSTGTIWPAAGAGGPTVVPQQLYDFTWAVQSVSDNAGTWTYAFGEPISPDPDEVTTNTITDPLGLVTTIEVQWYEDRNYDTPIKKARLKSITDPLGNKTDYGIDNQGRLRSVTNPEGDSQAWTYTALGTLRQWTHTPKAGSPLGAASITATYPATPCTGVLCGLPVSVTDARGGVTDYTYDASGNLLTETGPAPTPGAPRPQTRYVWAQRYAWYKQNGSSAITQAASPVWVQVEQSSCMTGATC